MLVIESHFEGLITPERIAIMKQNGTLELAKADLRSKLDFHRKKVEEIEAAIRALDRVTTEPGSITVENKEFAALGIAEAAVKMIHRAKRPLHVKEIAQGLEAGGYTFKTGNPLGSIAPVLYMAARDKKYGLISKGKNTYSLTELEG